MGKHSIKKDRILYILVFVIVAILRIYFSFNTSYEYGQHDVPYDHGHMGYAIYIYKNLSLPKDNGWQFYQPPLNAIIQATFMKLISFFTGIKNVDTLYQYCIILACIYSILLLIVVYKILDSLNISGFIKGFVFVVLSFYPGLIFASSQFNNDPLALLLFFISIYFAVKWCKNYMESKSIKYIVCLAISIALGMLTKISVGLIAFIIGPMLVLIFFIRLFSIKSRDDCDKKIFGKVVKELIIFAIIVFPLGLSYAIRNYALFGQAFNYVPWISDKKIWVGDDSIIDRVFSFPISHLYGSPAGIYHFAKEPNIWVDLIKTATFDESYFGKTPYDNICHVYFVLNVLFSFLSVIATIYNIFLIKCDKYNDLRNMSFLMIIVSTISFVIFNIKFPMSCTSSFRYISYATFAYAAMVAFMIEDIIKKISNVKNVKL